MVGTWEKTVFGSENYTEPVKLDTGALASFAVSASVNDRGIAKTIRLTQGDVKIYITPAEILALAEMIK